jgi:hypothetical protein
VEAARSSDNAPPSCSSEVITKEPGAALDLPLLRLASPLDAEVFAGQQCFRQGLYPLSLHRYKILDDKTCLGIKSYLFFTVGFIP